MFTLDILASCALLFAHSSYRLLGSRARAQASLDAYVATLPCPRPLGHMASSIESAIASAPWRRRTVREAEVGGSSGESMPMVSSSQSRPTRMQVYGTFDRDSSDRASAMRRARLWHQPPADFLLSPIEVELGAEMRQNDISDDLWEWNSSEDDAPEPVAGGVSEVSPSPQRPLDDEETILRATSKARLAKLPKLLQCAPKAILSPWLREQHQRMARRRIHFDTSQDASETDRKFLYGREDIPSNFYEADVKRFGVGREGLRELASRCHESTCYVQGRLVQVVPLRLGKHNWKGCVVLFNGFA